MNTDTPCNPPADAVDRIPLTAVREVIRRQPHSVAVADDSEQHLSPSNPETAHHFFRTQMTSYADLQVLGFVPRRLNEERVRQAIGEDDRELFKALADGGSLASGGCGCADKEPGHRPARSKTTPLRASYNAVRSAHNPALARVMSDHLGTTIDWDTPAVAVVRKWATTVKNKPTIVGLLLEDITINRNATLTIAASTRAMLVHDIFIHRTGTLQQQGGYMRVWANSVTQFSFQITKDTLATIKATKAAWLMND